MPRSFFKLDLGSLLGIVIGVLGLIGSGTLVVTIAPAGWLVSGIILSTIFVAVGGYSLHRYIVRRSIPFADMEHMITLLLSLSGANKDHVRAHLTRAVEFTPRSRAYTQFNRYQLVPDLPTQAADVVIGATNHSFTVSGRNGPFRKGWHPTEAVSLKPEFDEFRRLTLNYDFPSPIRDAGNRIRIEESLDLPNDFSGQLEYYSVEISEHVRRRKFTIISSDFKIEQASATITHGGRRISRQQLKVATPDGFPNGSCFTFEARNLAIGAKLRIEWIWRGVKPSAAAVGAPHTGTAAS